MCVAENLIETRDLTKRYGRKRAVDGVTLTVGSGEIYGFLGPNGAGKTTMLRMLLGLIRPTSGTATVLGQPPGAPAALAKIGMLVESPGMYPYLTGLANLRALALRAGIPFTSADNVLELVGLSGSAGVKYGKYSLGMKQRLGVAAALLKDPELLILDEPSNGLDPRGMVEMRDLIGQLADSGWTVVLSSHLLSEVQLICDRIGVISGGRLVRQGTVPELLGTGRLRIATDQLTTARSLVSGMVGADRVSIVDGQLAVESPAGESVDAAEINRQLVAAGISVRGLSMSEPRLEDLFFEATENATENSTENSNEDAVENAAGDRVSQEVSQ